MSACIPQLLSGASFTTYRIGGPLAEAYQPTSEPELITVLRDVQTCKKALTILGWGGNTLIASQGIPGVTLITRKLDTVVQITPTSFRFGAGVHLAKVSSTALQHSLTGGEFMIGIPGTIGGAIRMNAGALGQETGQLVQQVSLFNRVSGKIEQWQPEQLAFQYRKSAIDPTLHVVLSAELRFQPGDAAIIQQTMAQSVGFRKHHHPKEPNGGSVFKNPHPEKPMGRLMEELGAKGQWREGGVMVSPLHGNFIVNVDHGTSTDVLRLMRRMQLAVWEQYGLMAHPENLFLGQATEEEQQLWQVLTDQNPH